MIDDEPLRAGDAEQAPPTCTCVSDGPLVHAADCTWATRHLSADAQPGEAEQAGGLTDDDRMDLLLARGYADDGEHLFAVVERILAARAGGGPDEWRDRHIDLVSRLGFGDNITEPMADNDTIVAWFEERGREADEWREHERWRDDCHIAGHPDDEDCEEHGPSCCVRTHPGGPDDGTAERALADIRLHVEHPISNLEALRAAADTGHQGGES